jgi:allantoate deiminase
MSTKPSARLIWDHCEELAQCSEQPDALTRIFLSKEQAAASQLALRWMREAGMQAGLDAIGNVVGRYEGDRPGLPCLMLGSHLDTVRDAGKYDGPLGVISAIECVRALNGAGRRLPFAVEVVGFCDEEGVRFGATLLGSRAVAGTFDPVALDSRDRNGVSMREALDNAGFDAAALVGAARAPEEVLAYAELHIEQGPVLEAEGLAVGTVTAINGFSRRRVSVTGFAGHAGTVPMRLRQDALAAAAECVLAVERIGRSDPDLVATVGRIEAFPGAINVIPGEARFTVDIRAPRDDLRGQAVDAINAEIARLCAARGLAVAVEVLQDNPVAASAPWLMEQMDAAIAAEGLPPYRLASGAGHDGMAIVAIAPIVMLFVRCEKGISHNPAERVTLADVEAGARVLLRFIENFKRPA